MVLKEVGEEKARLQKEANMRGERLPGAEKSTKCGGQQQQTEQVEEDDTSGCYICTAKFYDS